MERQVCIHLTLIEIGLPSTFKAEMSMQNISRILLLLALQSPFTMFGQDYSPSKVIGPSPTAASLGRFGDMNVSYYTGMPDIIIPLYDIKTSNHSMPVRMRYNASAIRVGEEAGWGGLGWALECGGVITRTIRGKDDFDSEGYYTATALPATPDPSIPASVVYFNAILSNTIDAEPDILNYNFAGFTGKFVFGKLSDGSKAFIADRNNFKIEFTGVPRKWIITTGNGYKYIFGVEERVRDYFNTNTAVELPDDEPLGSYTYQPGPDKVTAWYLEEAISPTGESVTFQYEIRSTSLSVVNKYQADYNILGIGYICSGTPGSITNNYKTFNSSRQAIQDVYLKKVIFKNGSIEITTLDRTDREYLFTDKPQKLSELMIKNEHGQLLRKFVFDHSYFNSATNDQRLKLDKITEVAGDGTTKPPHEFSYFEPNNLPSKYSKQIDHWGYPNGKLNSILLPEQILITDDSRFVFAGADRTPLGDDEVMKRGVLSFIKYPTGGLSNFDYECHVYGNPQGDDKYIKTGHQAIAMRNPGASIPYNYFATFELADTTSVTFAYDYLKLDPNDPNHSLEGVQTVYAYVYKVGDPVPIYSYNTWACGTPPCGSEQPGEEFSTVLLDPGQYRIEVAINNDYYFYSLIAKWNSRTELTQRKGGGLRLKSMNSTVDGAIVNKRRFLYTNDSTATSGLLISQPLYSYLHAWQNTAVNQCIQQLYYLGRTTSSYVTNGLASSGAIVGYSKVTELMGENGENGKNEYYYYNDIDPVSIPFLPGPGQPLNGKLATHIVKTASNTQLKKADYNYTVKSITSLPAIKVHQAPPAAYGQNSYYNVHFYENRSNWAVLTSEVERDYTASGDMVSTTEYSYDNADHMELTRQQTTGSDGKIQIRKFKYPNDYTSAGTNSFAYQMKQLHMISPVIEEQSLIKEGTVEKLVGSTVTEYKQFNGTFYKPYIIHKLETTVPQTDLTQSDISSGNVLSLHPQSKPDTYLDEYSSNGNLVSFHSAYDMQQNYLWAYNNTLPVANVKNAKKSHVYYESFEDLNSSTWGFVPVIFDNNKSHSGKQAGRLNVLQSGGYEGRTSVNVILPDLTAPKKFIFSAWVYSEVAIPEITLRMLRLNNAEYFPPANGNIINTTVQKKWVYLQKEIEVPADIYRMHVYFTATGAGSVWFDDIRVYPSDAEIATYTYDPLLGMTSEANDRNQFIFYQYDEFGRLALVLDKDRNILKKYCYNYAGQPQDCNLYYNQETSIPFIQQGCGSPGGSTVDYTVPAGRYLSSVSQDDANQQAVNEANANGQAHANSTGDCTPTVYARIVLTNYEYGLNYIFVTPTVRFYSDAAGTIPVSVTNLTLNYWKDRTSCDGTLRQIFSAVKVCNGYETVLDNEFIYYTDEANCWNYLIYPVLSSGYIPIIISN